MSNKVQCPYGHFYKADKYETCPICSRQAQSGGGARAEEPPRMTTASRSAFEETAPPPAAVEPPASPHKSMPWPFGRQAAHAQIPPANEVDKTVAIRGAVPPEPGYIPAASPLAAAPPVSESPAPLPPVGAPAAPVQGPAVPADPEAAEPAPVPPQMPSQAPPSPLQAAVNAAASYAGGQDVKTMAVWDAPAGAEPVVGWLVCIQGEYFGQSFPLKTGNNGVGRAMHMDIPLAQEPTVSRNKHCVITFEPQNQEFYIQQGESSGLTYLNDEMVLSPVRMAARDRIRLGKAEFILVPLCTDGFRWEDFMDR